MCLLFQCVCYQPSFLGKTQIKHSDAYSIAYFYVLVTKSLLQFFCRCLRFFVLLGLMLVHQEKPLHHFFMQIQYSGGPGWIQDKSEEFL